MYLKNFIKPDPIKALMLLIIGGTLFSLEWSWIPKCCDFIYYQGLPLPVYYWGGFAGFPKTFIFTNFIFDGIVWYFTAIMLAFLISKVRKR